MNLKNKKLIAGCLILISLILLSYFVVNSNNQKNKDLKKEKLTESQKNLNANKNTIPTVNTDDTKTVIPTKNVMPTNSNNPNVENTTKVNPPDPNTKIAYLTFDDGPSREITPQILDTLDKYKIKATFFVIGKLAEDNKDLIAREYNDGNVIANHTYDHNVDYSYKSPENLVSEFDHCDKILKSLIPNYNKKIVRFPGGSKNRAQIYRTAVNAAGYNFFDWDCLTRDAEVSNISVTEQLKNINRFFIPKDNDKNKNHDKDKHKEKNKEISKNRLILLMHDGASAKTTAEGLPKIIEHLQSKGYSFGTIN